MKVILSTVAQDAIEGIREFYLEHAPEALPAVFEPVVKGLDLLAVHPRAGQPNRQTGLDGEIRMLVAAPYRILYEIQEEKIVLIHSIRHGRQRPQF